MAAGEVLLCKGRATPVVIQAYQQGQQAQEARWATIGATVINMADYGFGNVCRASALWALISVCLNPVSLTLTGQPPTATFGTLLNPGTSVIVWGQPDMNRIRMVRATGGDARVTIILGW